MRTLIRGPYSVRYKGSWLKKSYYKSWDGEKYIFAQKWLRCGMDYNRVEAPTGQFVYPAKISMCNQMVTSEMRE